MPGKMRGGDGLVDQGCISMEHVDCIVVGAGVLGLACARALAMGGRQTIVLEAQTDFGTGVSARNSEVIHAGLYYPAGSLKARLCVQGREQLYRYAAQRGIAHRKLGKLVVATDAGQVDALAALLRQAHANGVDDLAWLDAAQARTLEPGLRCIAAVHSPSTGIVDARALMVALLGDLEAHGGSLALVSPLQSAQRRQGVWEITTGAPSQPYRIGCTVLVNAAGLAAQQVASCIEGVASDRIPALRLARGCYFSLSGAAPFARLIYPMPSDGGLGVHLTLDMGGGARFGPDVEWVDRIDYRVDPDRAIQFYPSIRSYWPQLPDGGLQPAYAGIRPKLSGPGEPARDFVIDGPGSHGLPGLVQLFGIESPGLTSSLAIADQVEHLLRSVH